METSFVAYELLFNSLETGGPTISELMFAHHLIDTVGPPSPEEVGKLLRVTSEYKGGFYFPKFIKYLADEKFLKNVLPEIDKLRYVNQKKSRLRICNALDHSILVSEYAAAPLLKVCALYHDVGKANCKGNSFKGHELESVKIVGERFDYYKMNPIYIFAVKKVIANHMKPHAYQRATNKVWDDERVRAFMEECIIIHYVIDTIFIAIADKRASHNNEEYIKPYLELLERSIKLYNEDSEENVCPLCAMDGLVSFLDDIVAGKNLGDCYCGRCKTFYKYDEDGELKPQNVVVLNAEANIGGGGS